MDPFHSPVQVAWLNDKPDPQLDACQAVWTAAGLAVQRMSATDAQRSNAALRVLPAWAYSLPRLRLEALADDRPTLFLLQSPEQVQAVLAFARDRDELARTDESAACLGLRMRRLALRSARHDEQVEASQRDPLTRLWNRAAMQPWLDQAAQAEPSDEFVCALLFVDIDHFKRLNDEHGHGAGDEVLSELARAMRQWLQPADRLARWGGEEFLLLIQRSDPDAVQHQAERLRQGVDGLVFAGLPDTLQVSVSIGTALHEAGDTVEAWLSRADMALYQAKATGRSRVCSYEALRDSTSTQGSLMAQHFDSVTQVVTQRVATLVSNMGRQMLRSVQREAEQDALTGVPNRRVFDQRLPRELNRAGRDAAPVTVLLLDIDHFGRFNRDHGVPTGDAVLRQFAQNLAAAIRPKDWLARYGGEEFCVVMPEALPDAVAAAERLCEQVAATPLRGQQGQVLHITVSIGVARSLGAEEDRDALLLRASRALQLAKQQGRNRVLAAD